MADPPRLRSDSGSLEALLLGSARSCEPPALAEQEVWRRIQVIGATGAAVGAAGLAAQSASAGSKWVAGAVWSSILKWTAIVAVGVPAAGLPARWALQRMARPAAAVAVAKPAIAPRPVATEGVPPVDDSPAHGNQTGTPSPVDLGPQRPAAAWPRHVGGAASGGSTVREVPSDLRRESLSLAAARAKYASGNPRDALDDVARLGVEFPHGVLVQEREVLAIDSLTALGDTDGARLRAQMFLDRFPMSPYLAHVRHLTGR
jgi:hypothetical protein